MNKIAIAGYTGSGKSYCATLIKNKGFKLFDADSIAKEMMDSNCSIKEQLAQTFGSSVVSENCINYRTLGKIVFQSIDTLKIFNQIVHPPLSILLCELIQANEKFILDGALLPLFNLDTFFDRCLWVHADEKIRLARLIKRTGLPESDILTRMHIQHQLMEKPNRNTYLFIENNSSLPDLERQMEQIFVTQSKS